MRLLQQASCHYSRLGFRSGRPSEGGHCLSCRLCIQWIGRPECHHCMRSVANSGGFVEVRQMCGILRSNQYAEVLGISCPISDCYCCCWRLTCTCSFAGTSTMVGLYLEALSYLVIGSQENQKAVVTAGALPLVAAQVSSDEFLHRFYAMMLLTMIASGTTAICYHSNMCFACACCSIIRKH